MLGAMSVQVVWPDAVELARSLRGAAAWCWLDGEHGEPGARRSYLAVASEVRQAERGREREFLAALREAAASGRDAAGALPLWVVALGYEFGVALLDLPPAADDVAPAFALRLDTVLVLDHDTGRAERWGPDAPWVSNARWVSDARWVPSSDRTNAPICTNAPETARFEVQNRRSVQKRGSKHDGSAPAWRRTETEYVAQVEACRAAIRDGDAYVLCLTDTATVPGADPLELYLQLRGASRGAVIVAGDRALLSASPERFLSVHDGSIATHPIKGTRPRGSTPAADAALRDELAHDPKERAENLMIVDLMRNDLSRVCEPGTVRTTGFLRVEPHPHVHQLVSTVTGALTPQHDVYDAIAACFPGGSMTGAPKRRAVELLGALERGPRGLYSGCFGWIDAAGDAELAMTIRGVELRGLGSTQVEARVGAGGGITIDSDATREYREKGLKAAPLLAALGDAARYS